MGLSIWSNSWEFVWASGCGFMAVWKWGEDIPCVSITYAHSEGVNDGANMGFAASKVSPEVRYQNAPLLHA